MNIFKLLFNKLSFYLSIFFLAYIIITLYCSIFKISYNKFFVYYILPIFNLFVYLINIIIIASSFPYYITIELWNILLKILGMFTFVITFINNIGLFFINLSSDVYLVT
jgi:hypothetical protein